MQLKNYLGVVTASSFTATKIKKIGLRCSNSHFAVLHVSRTIRLLQLSHSRGKNERREVYLNHPAHWKITVKVIYLCQSVRLLCDCLFVRVSVYQTKKPRPVSPDKLFVPAIWFLTARYTKVQLSQFDTTNDNFKIQLRWRENNLTSNGYWGRHQILLTKQIYIIYMFFFDRSWWMNTV